jgi:PilZ domain-containing protein
LWRSASATPRYARAAKDFVHPIPKGLLKAGSLRFGQIVERVERPLMPQELTRPSRRLIERTPAKTKVFVHCRGRFQRATIANYSHDGAQLEGTFGLFKYDPVSIELPSGLKVPGKVEWSLGGQTGIAFAERLAETHPAIIELARKAT